MAAVAAEYEGRVAFVGMAGRGELAEMQDFVADTGTGGIVHVQDTDGALWQRFGVVAQPAFTVIPTDGTSRTSAGGMDADSLRQVAESLLAP